MNVLSRNFCFVLVSRIFLYSCKHTSSSSYVITVINHEENLGPESSEPSGKWFTIFAEAVVVADMDSSRAPLVDTAREAVDTVAVAAPEGRRTSH